MASAENYLVSKFTNFEKFSQFVHRCINDLTNNPNNIKVVTGGSTEWSEDESRLIQKYIQQIYRDSVLKDELAIPNNFPDEARTVLEDIFKCRKQDILNSVIKEHLTSTGHNVVENFDWKLKWILGSSKVASIREPICQLDLECICRNEKGTLDKNTINFEMNLEKLEKFVSVLRNIKKQLDEENRI